MTAAPDDLHPLDDMARAFARVGELIARDDVCAVLGPSHMQELATVVVGFRQRFPQHWPGAQQGLPLTAATGTAQGGAP